MKINFIYNEDKDVDCLMKFGKGSTHSSTQTKVYQELVAFSPNLELSKKITWEFINEYINKNQINVDTYLATYRNDWGDISAEFQKRAEEVFGISLPDEITAYLTINNRCPYSIPNNYFYVQMPRFFARDIVMHELWHFYTWYKFGAEWTEKLGNQKYEDLKEALTVLLNAECNDLFPYGKEDAGYAQHKELREEIKKLSVE